MLVKGAVGAHEVLLPQSIGLRPDVLADLLHQEELDHVVRVLLRGEGMAGSSGGAGLPLFVIINVGEGSTHRPNQG